MQVQSKHPFKTVSQLLVKAIDNPQPPSLLRPILCVQLSVADTVEDGVKAVCQCKNERSQEGANRRKPPKFHCS